MTAVLDCTFCAALFLPHERSARVKEVFRGFDEAAEVLVPVQWWTEMTELIWTAIVRGRLKHADAVEISGLLEQYRFVTETAFGAAYTERIIDLSGLYGINPLEASYLELAVRKQARLGTLDGKLRAACQKSGVELLL
ncbi:MAG: type II toxin-antitoxin system VapC family toxin [Treponema sp.]|jgi:predicted nucleic acid-binding protein|nr:type II toxin-antitoxin system VapC family toxin [Treponema sp.]